MAETDMDDVYEIERILAQDSVDGEMFYLVKWKGYPDEECTWEPGDNFSSQASINEWQEQNAQGLGLPDEFLADLQQKMDEFQERNQPSDEPSEPQQKDDHMVVESTAGSPTKQHKHLPCVDHDATLKKLDSNNTLVRKRGIAATVKPTPPKRRPSEMQPRSIFIPKGTLKPHQARPSNMSKAGQKFRNLKHMNNYRKKSRTEPEPNLPPEKLKAVADFNIGRTTAHILQPVTNLPERNRDDSPLFIPDTSTIQQDRGASPARSDSFVFPPAPVDHNTDVNTHLSDRSEPLLPGDVNAMDFDSREDHTSAISSILEPVDDYPRAEVPPSSTIVRASNGRWWYRGDIMCYFMMGKPIGDATIVDAPFYDFGSHIVALKSGHHNLLLEFEPRGYNQMELEVAFVNSHVPPLALGVVNSFSDTARSFEEFAVYLEKNDSVAVYHFPNPDLDRSLLLYSHRSASWQYLGRKPARNGPSRLHIAFMPRLISRDAKGPVRKAESRGGAHSSSAVQPTQLHTTQAVMPPSTSHKTEDKDVLDAKLHISTLTNPEPYITIPQSPAAVWTSCETTPTTMTPESPRRAQSGNRDPRLRRASSFADQAQKSGSVRLRSSTKSLRGWQKLDYQSLVSPTTLNLRSNLDSTKARFFIAFDKEYPEDAKVIQAWLGKHVKSSNIYLKSALHDWARFKEKALDTMSILLFHAEQSDYFTLDGLGAILCSEVPSCISLHIEREGPTKPGSWGGKMKPLFPRNAMYLITETMITGNLEATIAIVQYFDSTKKPNYRIVTRPRIKRWLLEYSAKENDEIRQGKLIDLLVLIRKLHLDPTAEGDLEETTNLMSESTDEVESVMNTSYIVSPSSLTGYDDSNFSSPTAAYFQTEAQNRRDEVLKTFYYCYTVVRAEKARRFISFYPRRDTENHFNAMKRMEVNKTLNCGHVMFWELEKFVTKFCQDLDKRKN